MWNSAQKETTSIITCIHQTPTLIRLVVPVILAYMVTVTHFHPSITVALADKDTVVKTVTFLKIPAPTHRVKMVDHAEKRLHHLCVTAHWATPETTANKVCTFKHFKNVSLTSFTFTAIILKNDVSFDGTGYLEFNKDLLQNEDGIDEQVIALELTTNRSTGLIFWFGQRPNEDGQGQDYVSLASKFQLINKA